MQNNWFLFWFHCMVIIPDINSCAFGRNWVRKSKLISNTNLFIIKYEVFWHQRSSTTSLSLVAQNQIFLSIKRHCYKSKCTVFFLISKNNIRAVRWPRTRSVTDRVTMLFCNKYISAIFQLAINCACFLCKLYVVYVI